MLSRIYLIRHGKTEGNRNHWYYGSTDLPLTEEGAGEIEAYAEEGIYPEIPENADFYTTGLIRTDQTLEAIYGKHEHSAIPKLQEIDFGKAECMTYDDLKQFDNFEKWAWDTTGDVRIADAETANEFHARIYEGLKELLDRHHMKEQHMQGGMPHCKDRQTHSQDGTLNARDGQLHGQDRQDAVSVVVCHGGVIACIMEKLFPAVCGSMWDWLPEPGFGYAVDFQDGEPFMYSKINDIGRLGLGLYRLPLRNRAPYPQQSLHCAVSGDAYDRTKPRQIDHKAVKALIDTQMQKGHGYFELEFLAWPDECERQESDPDEPGITKKIKAVREALVRRYDRSRYHLTAIIDASMLAEAEALIKKSGAGCLDRLAVCGIERYYENYPEDKNIEPETLADKRIDGPQEESGRPVSADLEAVWAEVARLKKAGLIRKGGLAFCGSATLLDDLLKDRQEIEYVELPVNYRMGSEERDLAQKYYTISRRRYKEILVRSPFAGGELARSDEVLSGAVSDRELYKAHVDIADDAECGQVSETDLTDATGSCKADEQTADQTGSNSHSCGSEAVTDREVLRRTMAGYALLKQDAEPRSAVDWALRYVLSFPFVVTCVASTGDPGHAAENMDAADRFRPLTEEQREQLKSIANAK